MTDPRSANSSSFTMCLTGFWRILRDSRGLYGEAEDIVWGLDNIKRAEASYFRSLDSIDRFLTISAQVKTNDNFYDVKCKYIIEPAHGARESTIHYRADTSLYFFDPSVKLTTEVMSAIKKDLKEIDNVYLVLIPKLFKADIEDRVDNAQIIKKEFHGYSIIEADTVKNAMIQVLKIAVPEKKEKEKNDKIQKQKKELEEEKKKNEEIQKQKLKEEREKKLSDILEGIKSKKELATTDESKKSISAEAKDQIKKDVEDYILNLSNRPTEHRKFLGIEVGYSKAIKLQAAAAFLEVLQDQANEIDEKLLPPLKNGELGKIYKKWQEYYPEGIKTNKQRKP